jgi:predicted RNA binding protein YcfA (HicA-like mRNA interferase family)
MPKLPRDLSGRRVIRALERADFRFARRVGSHCFLERWRDGAVVSVPDHRHIAPGTLRGIIREAGLTVQEFVDLL